MRVQSVLFLSQFLKNVPFKNFVNLSLNQGINVVTALIITPFLFQTLEEQYGLVALGFTVILLFGLLVNYGFNLNTPGKLALVKADRKALELMINEVISTRLLISVVLALMLFVSIHYFNAFSGYSVIVIFSAVQLFNDALFPMFILQGLDRLSWISTANAISKLLYLCLVLLFINDVADARWVNFILGGTGVVVHAGLLAFIYKKEQLHFYWVGFRKIGTLLLNNFQFFSSTVASYILINGGFILLENFVSDTELSFYALAQRVSLLLRMVPLFITQAILQKTSRLYKEDVTRFNRYLSGSYRNGLVFTFFMGLVFSISSKWVVWVLAGKYIPMSANLMAILSFLPFLAMLNVSNMIRILVADQKQILAKATWLTSILILLSGSISACYFGSFGLAWVLIFGELFNFLIHRALLKGNKSLDY